MAFVPGVAFEATPGAVDRLRDRIRLSFATLAPEQLDEAARRLASSLPA